MKQGIVNKMIGIGMEGCAKEAYAAGLERGRALGAREEREACLNIAEDRVAAMAYRSAPRLNEAREIANMLRARRSGGQGK
jgi:hypothetical protein